MKQLFLVLVLFTIPGFMEAELHPLSEKTNLLYSQKNYESALLACNELLQEFPQRKEGYFNRGLCLYQTEKYSEAIFDFNEALSLDTLLYEAQLMKAFCLEKSDQLPEAVSLYTVLLNKDATIFPLQERIKNYQLSVYIATKWYYMIALFLIAVIIMVVAARYFSTDKL